METIITIIENFLSLSNAIAFYLILGVLFAGILKEFISDDFITKHLGKSDKRSVVKATLLGIPLPVCSCSVIPLAKSLKKEGASKGSIQSFLISTPITGVDSIMATYSLFGFVFTLYRVVTSVFIAVFTGFIQNSLDNKQMINQESGESCCSKCCGDMDKDTKKSFSIKRVLNYAFVTLFADMVKPLLIGLVVGAMFMTFLPKELTQTLFEHQFLTYFAVMLISLPLYVCATASLPLAAAFLLQGMSPGAAFVFLSAGPATNSVTMSIVYDMLGKKAFYIYMVSIATLSILFGYLFDTFFGELNILSSLSHEMEMSGFNILTLSLFFGLIIYFLIKRR